MHCNVRLAGTFAERDNRTVTGRVAGRIAGTLTGTVARTVAGTVVGTAAGTVAGTIAGTIDGTSAGGLHKMNGSVRLGSNDTGYNTYTDLLCMYYTYIIVFYQSRSSASEKCSVCSAYRSSVSVQEVLLCIIIRWYKFV